MRRGVATEKAIIGEPAPREEAVVQHAGRGQMTNAQVHPMPTEILRLPDGFLRMTKRVDGRLKPSLRSSEGRLAGRYRGMNVWGIACR